MKKYVQIAEVRWSRIGMDRRQPNTLRRRVFWGGGKNKKTWMIVSLSVVVVALIVGFAAYRLYFMPKMENDKVYAVVEGCFDALQSGDLDGALAYTDYDKEESVANYLISSDNIQCENAIANAVFTVIRTDEIWEDALDFGLKNLVTGYEIKEVFVDGENAIVRLEIQSPDFEAAAKITGDNLAGMLTGYGADDVTSIIANAIVGIATKDPIAIGSAVLDVVKPVYSQWPEQIKANIGTVEARSVNVELRLEKIDKKWIIKSDGQINSIENYVTDVCNALFPSF